MAENLLNLQSVEMKWAYEQQARELEQLKRMTDQLKRVTDQLKRVTEQLKKMTEQSSLANIEMLEQFGIILTDEQVQEMLKHAVEQKTED